jgi:hypothetical protein
MNIVIVRDNIVENIGVSPLDGPPPEGTTAHEFDGFVSIGWTWNDGNPVDPNPLPQPVDDGRASERALILRRADELEASPDLAKKYEGLKLRLSLVTGG